MKRLIMTIMAVVFTLTAFGADRPATNVELPSQFTVVIEDGVMLLLDNVTGEFFGNYACTFNNGEGTTYTYWWSTNTGTAYGASVNSWGYTEQWTTTIYAAASICDSQGSDGKNGINPSPSDYLSI